MIFLVKKSWKCNEIWNDRQNAHLKWDFGTNLCREGPTKIFPVWPVCKRRLVPGNQNLDMLKLVDFISRISRIQIPNQYTSVFKETQAVEQVVPKSLKLFSTTSRPSVSLRKSSCPAQKFLQHDSLYDLPHLLPDCFSWSSLLNFMLIVNFNDNFRFGFSGKGNLHAPPKAQNDSYCHSQSLQHIRSYCI